MKKIAYLGLGIMGRGMAANLLKAGYPVTVWNRTAERCAPLVAQGAQQAASPAEAAAGADLIMYCLSDDAPWRIWSGARATCWPPCSPARWWST
jgi:3-hydroxyisobutyrate dehydrogenase-like beta-hydroxyacid dehydrogenase